MNLAGCTVWVPSFDPSTKHCGKYKRHAFARSDERFVIEASDPMVHRMFIDYRCKQCGLRVRVQSLVVVPEADTFDGGLVYEIPQPLLIAARGRVHQYSKALDGF